MKRIILCGWISTILLLIAEITGILYAGKYWITWTIIALILALNSYTLIKMYQQQRVMFFLLEEQKRENRISAGSKMQWNQEEEDKLDVIKKRVELYTLQSQINPHFLYNTLDSIRCRALLDGQGEIASMTEILSKFFRYCISNDESLVKIKEEITHIQDYYFIQKYRFEDRFAMEITMENEEIGDYYIPKMTLQPLVENAMIHGLEKVNRKGVLELKLITTGNKVIITVSDNGAGMNVEELDRMNQKMDRLYMQSSKKGKHNSIAITNVNTRIRLTFGEGFGIQYRSMLHEGTDAIVTIPVINDFTRVRYEDRLVD